MLTKKVTDIHRQVYKKLKEIKRGNKDINTSKLRNKHMIHSLMQDIERHKRDIQLVIRRIYATSKDYDESNEIYRENV